MEGLTLGEYYDHLNDQIVFPVKPYLPFVRFTDIHLLSINELKKYLAEKIVYNEAMARYDVEHSIAVQQSSELKQQFKQDLFKTYPVWKNDNKVLDGIYYKVLLMHLPTYSEFEREFKKCVDNYNCTMEGLD